MCYTPRTRDFQCLERAAGWLCLILIGSCTVDRLGVFAGRVRMLTQLSAFHLRCAGAHSVPLMKK